MRLAPSLLLALGLVLFIVGLVGSGLFILMRTSPFGPLAIAAAGLVCIAVHLDRARDRRSDDQDPET